MFKLTHREAFEESIRVLKNNLILFLPNLFMIIVSLILGIAYFRLTGLHDFFVTHIQFSDTVASQGLIDFFHQRWAWLLLLFVGYIILLFLSDIFFSLTKYGMIKDVIAAKKSTLQDGFDFAKKHFSSSLLIHIFSVVLIMLPLVVIAIIFSRFFTSITLLVIFSIFAALYKFLAIFRLVLPYPIMAFEGKGAYKSIKTDLHYLKTQMGHLFISWLLITGVTYMWISQQTDPIELLFMVSILISLIIFEMILSTWEHLYILEAHISKKTIKKGKI